MAGGAQVRVVTGQFRGIGLRCIDTPGLTMSGSSLTSNSRILHTIKKAMKKHRPDLVLYVDRQDMVRSLACRLFHLSRFPPLTAGQVPEAVWVPHRFWNAGTAGSDWILYPVKKAMKTGRAWCCTWTAKKDCVSWPSSFVPVRHPGWLAEEMPGCEADSAG